MEKGLVRKHLVWLLIAAWVYTFTFIFNNYWSKYASYRSVVKAFQKSLTERERRFSEWVADTSQLEELSRGIKSVKRLEQIKKLPFYVFVYPDNDSSEIPYFWSTNEVLPDPYHLAFYPSGSYVKFGSGQYELLKRRVKLKNETVVVAGMIKLHEQFFIRNLTFHNDYPEFPGLGDKMQLLVTPTAYPIYGENKKTIAYFQPLVKEPIYIFNKASFIVQILASIFLFIFISKISYELISKRVEYGLAFFILALLVLRWTVFKYGIPINFKQFPLFIDQALQDPGRGSSLREFMVNAFFGLWAGIFLTNYTGRILKLFGSLKKRFNWAFLVLLAFCVTGGHFFLVYRIYHLYLSSSVAFDLNNFFSLNYTTILSFFIIFMLCVNHYIVLRFMVLAFMRLSRSRNWQMLLLLGMCGLLIITFVRDRQLIIPLLLSLVWLLLFFTIGFTRFIKPARATSGMIVLWLFIYSFTISMLLSMLSETRLRTHLESLSKSLVLKKDETSEHAINVASQSLKRIDWWQIMNECKNEWLCTAKKDSIINTYFGGYLNRFNTNIYLFDRVDQPVFHTGSITYESLNILYSTQSKSSNYPGLSVLGGQSVDQFGYIIKQDIRNEDDDQLGGHLFVVIRDVRAGNKMLAPELFKQLQDYALDLPKGYSYAWYKNGSLQEQYRNYPFQASLPDAMSGINQQSQWERKTNDAFELWTNVGYGNALVMAGERNLVIGFISTLAYMFGAFLIFYCLMALLILLINGKLFSGEAFERINLNLQSKIRITVIAILTTSFIIVAVVTISFFINQFKSDNTEKLARTMQSISSDLTRSLPANYDSLSKEGQKAVLQATLNTITEGKNVDVNCFDSTGAIIASTQNALYDKGILSRIIDPLVWWNLTKGDVHRYVSAERIGDLEYSSIYQPLQKKNNQFFAYLQVPFFASQTELNQEISNFLVILINIIAFIFLLSGSFAFWISGNITRSFNVIAEKMNRIRLSEHNERIEWTPKDEIGNLVFQYNKMVDQLEESAKKMARNERELAWREMARQVAHEIKNPLTPMKLSLQFLQKAIQEKKSDVDQITERVASNLVGQIDHLSKIATEFSQFANLGNYKPEIFNLQFVMRDVIQMYELQENLSVRWHSLSQPLYVFADRTQINRLLTNLFQNAVEAGDVDKMTEIVIGEKLIPGALLLSFGDNGSGIPEAMKQNIFTPNFTTKSSGTGLGLSICKAIVENAGGAIWFETDDGIGTTFYVQLPIAK